MKKSTSKRQTLTNNLAVLSIVLVVVTLITVIRLGFVMFVKNDEYQAGAAKVQWSSQKIPALRGSIYDANGDILAQSAFVWSLYIIPANFRYSDDFAIDENFKKTFCLEIAAITGLDANKLTETCAQFQNKVSDKPKITVKKQIELEEKEKIEALKDKKFETTIKTKSGVIKEVEISYSKVFGFDTDVKRYYPYSTFASNLIGLMNLETNVGLTGIEAYYEEELSGKNGRKTAFASKIDEENATVYEAQDGYNLHLTIDRTIQDILTEQLTDAYEQSGGISASGIVMNISTGAVLGMETIGYKGSFDLNNRYELNDYFLTHDVDDKLSLMWNNYAISEYYYPGSVFKVFVSAAAIEEKVLPNDYSYICIGHKQVEDTMFNCHEALGHGEQDLITGLKNSCNPLFIDVGKELGADLFYKYFEAFGFTKKTGIDANYETDNSVSNYYTAKELKSVELASESFGQSCKMTPIQILTALCSIANGGKLLTPYVVDKITDNDGNVISKTQTQVKRQVISKQTAQTVANMMEHVVIDGTGKNGYVTGYRVAGKTGTTQKKNKKGLYIASFGCFAPVDNPQIAMLVIVDEPKGDYNGSTVCAPVAAKIAEQCLDYLGVEKEYTERDKSRELIKLPNLTGKSVDYASKTLNDMGFEVKIAGEGDTVFSQMPAGGQEISKNGTAIIYTDTKKQTKYTVMPSFYDLSASEAKQLGKENGINVIVVGNVLSNMRVYSQSVAFGTQAEYGSTVKVYLKTNYGVNDL